MWLGKWIIKQSNGRRKRIIIRELKHKVDQIPTNSGNKFGHPFSFLV